MGYSFITIGVVRMMGFQLQIHIEKPYFAVSVTDFGWRWYISLSSCSRDYFSIPLWGIERSGFFNGREKWAKGFENQRV